MRLQSIPRAHTRFLNKYNQAFIYGGILYMIMNNQQNVNQTTAPATVNEITPQTFFSYPNSPILADEKITVRAENNNHAMSAKVDVEGDTPAHIIVSSGIVNVFVAGKCITVSFRDGKVKKEKWV